MKDRLLVALRALADLPEHAADGALAWWLGELERVRGWRAVEREGLLDVIAPDGRSWTGIRLPDLLHLLEQAADA